MCVLMHAFVCMCVSMFLHVGGMCVERPLLMVSSASTVSSARQPGVIKSVLASSVTALHLTQLTNDCSVVSTARYASQQVGAGQTDEELSIHYSVEYLNGGNLEESFDNAFNIMLIVFLVSWNLCSQRTVPVCYHLQSQLHRPQCSPHRSIQLSLRKESDKACRLVLCSVSSRF